MRDQYRQLMTELHLNCRPFRSAMPKQSKDLIHEALREFIRLRNRKPGSPIYAGSIKFYKQL